MIIFSAFGGAANSICELKVELNELFSGLKSSLGRGARRWDERQRARESETGAEARAGRSGGGDKVEMIEGKCF